MMAGKHPAFAPALRVRTTWLVLTLVVLVACENSPMPAPDSETASVEDLPAAAPWPGERLQTTFVVRQMVAADGFFCLVGDPGLLLMSDEGDIEWIVETPGRARAAARLGSSWLVADGHAGLAVIVDGDIHERLDLGGEVTYVASQGDLAAATLFDGRLVVLGRSEAEGVPSVVALGALDIPGYPRFAAFARPEQIWVDAYTHGVVLVDATDPSRPRIGDHWNGLRKIDAHGTDGARLAIADASRRGAIVEATGAGEIAQILTIDLDGRTRGLVLDGSRLTVAGRGGLVATHVVVDQ